MIVWIQNHWVWVVLLWPILSALASLVYGRLNEYPRWHAFFSLMAAAGIDIPKILDAVGRWINRSPPSVGGHSPPLRFKPPPPPPGSVGLARSAT